MTCILQVTNYREEPCHTLPRSLATSPHRVRAFRALVSALLVVWVGLIFGFGATGAFVVAAGTPPLRLFAAVAGPVIAFLIAYRWSAAVREFALTADLRFITATQAWRFGGFAFLALYTYGVLPGYFAWPAGLGDMAIGAAAPWMLVGLAREPGFAASRRFVTWNVLGILDLIVAVTVGGSRAAALSQRGRCDLDGRDGASPARVDPRVLCAGLSHPARDRAGAGASCGVAP